MVLRKRRDDHADDVSIADEFPLVEEVDIEHEAGNAASYAAWKERLRTTHPMSTEVIRAAIDEAHLPDDEWMPEHLLEGTAFAEEMHDDTTGAPGTPDVSGPMASPTAPGPPPAPPDEPT